MSDETEKNKKNFKSQLKLWTAIGVALLVSAYFLFQMLRSPGADSAIAELGSDPSLEKPTVGESLSKKLSAEAKAMPLDEYLKSEAVLVGRPDTDPEASESRLREKASSLTATDLIGLTEKATSTQTDGDTRALAVQLVSYSPLSEKIDLLSNFALSTPPTFGEERRDFYEVALRAQAVEGIAEATSAKTKDAAIRALQGIPEKTDNQYLVDRANRALLSLQTGGASPEDQDKAALEELVHHDSE